ncbi:hypothetical protein P3T27_006604 [Kitasatospora sp. MAA19]|uniref:hypothetical protein n=1 Tax=Kitasatospora sp. MAA19 TaxID=3035090 RepID=UPI0024746038|nr:hypothetical protein [Kitasatospora sp. MAA19]MDH6709855.1 hypothetical protein [Kitasatospora sp. MAA19]
MSDTPTTPLAEAFTRYSTGMRDLVQELLHGAGPDTASDLADDLCGELWLHAAEAAASDGLSFTGLLDALDAHATILVAGLRDQPPVTAAGRLDMAADPVDIAELAVAAADGCRPPAASPPAPPHRRALLPAACSGLMRIHLVAYLARTGDGAEQGVARVPSGRGRPSWHECAAVVLGFLIGQYLGAAPEPEETRPGRRPA